MKTIVVGADHAGFKLKEQIKDFLEKWGYRVKDVGAYEVIPTDDYPEYAEKVALKVLAKRGGEAFWPAGPESALPSQPIKFRAFGPRWSEM
ncbi:MAG: RpiB/LacA/LacB family sugar-phosphate isomerase [Candidatus Manganitrophus sp.]|nr:RpiB/LacA/LacB family sugar-phosphate isomerase [Candidatus Manganitrophus sp.]